MPAPRPHPLLALPAALALACAPAAPRTTPAAAVLPATIPPLPGEPRPLFALRAIDVAPGTGAMAERGKCLFVHYTGWLTDGTKFDSSRDTLPSGAPREPIGFPLGARRVIAGWDAGFEGLGVGGRRRLFIPYQLAYGAAGRPPVIPPRAELIFDVEVMAVADTLANPDGRAGPGAPPPRCPEWAAVQG